MEIVHGYRELSRRLTSPAVALGNFDGVHRGHHALLDAAVSAARRRGGESVVYTFEPHPARVLAPKLAPALLTTPARKLELIAARGIDVCVLEPFTRALAEMPAEDFLEEALLGHLAPRDIIVGYDFGFGQGRQGNVNTLRDFGERHGIDVEVIEPVAVGGLVASSTKVREFVRAGNMAGARVLLDRDFEVEGEVVRGAARGKGLGFPTANIKPENELLPAGGVYAVTVEVLGDDGAPASTHGGAANIGTNPTFETEGNLCLEVYLLDFSGDLYGRRLRVGFVERLRPEHRFDGVDSLVAQMHDDVAKTREILRARGVIAA
jgi:riboflavin kinase / FMN adenylyltransferase